MIEPNISKERLEQATCQLVTLRHEKAALSRESAKLLIREAELAEPILTDLSLLGNIYDLFMSYHKIKKIGCLQRKQFVFIILFLYSPSALTGKKMLRGLRDRLCEVLGCTRTNISHDYVKVCQFYNTYNEFRNSTTDYLQRILTDLQK